MALTVYDNVVLERLEQELVLLNLGTGTYYALNRTGAEVFEMLRSHELEEVVDRISCKYSKPCGEVRDDVRRLLAELVRCGLIDQAQCPI